VKIIVKLGENTLEVEGEFVFDATFNAVLRTWINAALPNNDAIKLEEVTERLRVANEKLEATVTAFAP